MQCLNKRELTCISIVLIAALIIILILLGLIISCIVYPYIRNEPNAVHEGHDTILLPLFSSGSSRFAALVSLTVNSKTQDQTGFSPAATGSPRQEKISLYQKSLKVDL
jgi:hypothetical protein